MAELFEDDQVAAAIVDVGFDDLTEAIDESKITLAELLFKTAQQPSRDPVLARVAAAFALSRLPVFTVGPLGWDVRPALATSAKGAS